MGLLLLLTSMLLSSYFHPWRVVDAQSTFTINKISLSFEPSANVKRNTDVTLRCQAVVSSSAQGPLSRNYTIYKDGAEVLTKTSSTSEDFLYQLPKAKVSNTGKYKCMITIDSKTKETDNTKLTVTGLSVPELHLNKVVVSEGEEVTASCTAPDETGSFIFYFYEDSKEIREKMSNSNQIETKLRLSNTGTRKIHCAYRIVIIPDTFLSNNSKPSSVTVKEFPIQLDLEISPQYKIYEGDRLNFSCTIRKFQYNPQISQELFLSHGAELLSNEVDKPKVSHSMMALAKDSGEYECKLEMKNVVKVVKKTVSVTELFSVPTLTMSPAEVFKGDDIDLICKSEHFAYEILRKEEITYSLDPLNTLIQKRPGQFNGKVGSYDFNYTCIAKAKGIEKHSNTLTVRPKVSVSTPNISVVDRAILNQPFKILCQSDIGSLPINYTLLKDSSPLDTISIKESSQEALFTVTITHTDEINKYMCKAKNSQRDGLPSKRLNASVIVPLSSPTLTVIPPLPEISEGDHLYLICGIEGTPPVTFKWYRVGNEQPLHTITSNNNHTNYQVSELTKQHSGTYYCEADNYAKKVVRSEEVEIDVNLATWKKACIGGFSLLVVSVLAVVLVLRFRSKRDAAPRYDGMEGRVTNGTRDSAASLPADISNRSSYSIPATV